ncbi:protein kinase [Aureococcus anophagefferens]|nr:protein kinase [Aureococcus anophagefferens]
MEPYAPRPDAAMATTAPSRLRRLTLDVLDTYTRVGAGRPAGAGGAGGADPARFAEWIRLSTTPRAPGRPSVVPRRSLTAPNVGGGNEGRDNAEAELICYAGDVLGPGGDGPSFEIIDKLGKGSFGQVFRCRSAKTGRLVAIKVVKNCASYATQALVESQIARMLNSRGAHPHVVHLFGDFSHGGHTYVQSRFYRAPEVLVGAPYDGAIDVWSAACVVAELMLGLPVFPGVSAHNQITRAEMLGTFPDALLERGDDAAKYFFRKPDAPPPAAPPQPPPAAVPDDAFDDDGADAKFSDDDDGPASSYELKTPEAYARDTGSSVPRTKKYFQYKRLDEIVNHYPIRAGLSASDVDAERDKRKVFAHFVRGMLRHAPDERWTPRMAAAHPFLAGAALGNWQAPRTRRRAAPLRASAGAGGPAAGGARLGRVGAGLAARRRRADAEIRDRRAVSDDGSYRRAVDSAPRAPPRRGESKVSGIGMSLAAHPPEFDAGNAAPTPLAPPFPPAYYHQPGAGASSYGAQGAFSYTAGYPGAGVARSAGAFGETDFSFALQRPTAGPSFHPRAPRSPASDDGQPPGEYYGSAPGYGGNSAPGGAGAGPSRGGGAAERIADAGEPRRRRGAPERGAGPRGDERRPTRNDVEPAARRRGREASGAAEPRRRDGRRGEPPRDVSLAAMRAWDLSGAGPCPSDLKVYVYEYPGVESMAWYQHAKKMRQRCREDDRCANHYAGEHLLAQFSLELILHDFFTKACVRTRDPEAADLFFVPHYGDVLYRETGRGDKPSAYEAALLDILERQDTKAWERTFNVTGEYWTRRGGGDHVLVQPAPVTGLRHPKGGRGWTHYLQQLHAPIWISLELSRSFVAEYPACGRKNVVAPYPIPGRAWHDGQWARKARKAALAVFGPALPSVESSRPSRPTTARATTAASTSAAIAAEFADASLDQGGVGDGGFVLRDRAVDGADDALTKLRTQALRVPARPSCTSRTFARARGRLAVREAPVRRPARGLRARRRQRRRALGVFERDGPRRGPGPGAFALNVSEASLLQFDADPDKQTTVNTKADAGHAHHAGRDDADAFPLLGILGAARRGLAAFREAGATAAWAYRYYATGDYGDEDPLLAGVFPNGGALALLVRDLERRARGSRWPACEAELARPHFELKKRYCGAVPAAKEARGLRDRLRKTKDPAKRAAVQAALDAYEGGRVFRRRR